MDEVKWWFGFRQTMPEPPGQAIAWGPFDSYREAKAEMDRSKARDCEVSAPFPASTKDEAEAKAKELLG